MLDQRPTTLRSKLHYVLEFLHHEEEIYNGISRAPWRDPDCLDDWYALVKMKALLCARPAYPKLPVDIRKTIEEILIHDLTNRMQVSVLDIEFFLPRLRIGEAAGVHRLLPSLGVWKGDITTLKDATAIVNAANSKLLGCFVPGHRCIDNAIHTASGPELREACYALMHAQGHDEAEGQAKVTPGYVLDSEYVIHTVGPQVARGNVPSAQNRISLARCYESCLEAAESLPVPSNGRKVIVFCGISTGIFGFPSAEASAIAVGTVLDWFDRRETSSVTDVLFNVFREEDLFLYRRQLSEKLGSERLGKSLSLPYADSNRTIIQKSQNVEAAIAILNEADYLIVSVGAGLSASTGLDYTSNDLFAKKLPGFRKYGFRCLYDVFGFQSWPSNQARWSYLINHLILIRDWPRQKLYYDLCNLIKDRFTHHNADSRYFFRTSNADGFLARHGVSESRISTPQGSYAYVQCAQKCRKDAIFDSAPLVSSAEPYLDQVSQHLPDDFSVPTCRYCESDLVLCVRGGSYFNQVPFQQKEREYHKFCKEALLSDDNKVVILEIGVGMSTPSVLRWHNEELVDRAKGRMKLIRIGNDAAGFSPLDLVERRLGIGLQGDIRDYLEVILGEI